MAIIELTNLSIDFIIIVVPILTSIQLMKKRLTKIEGKLNNLPCKNGGCKSGNNNCNERN